MAITLETTQTSSFTSGTSLAIGLPSGVSSGDLILIIAGVESNSTLTTPSGYTEAATELVTASFDGSNLCRMYIFYKIAGGSESNPSTTSNSNTADKRFIAHRFSGVNAAQPIDIISSGTDNTKVYPPGSPPTFKIGAGDAEWFHKALFRVAICNDNGDSGTFDSTQTFTGHTRRSILTGLEVGAISIQKDSVSTGPFSTLTLATQSIDGGEVDGICFANIGILETASGTSANMMLLGVG
jgi:hypothetical protein